MTRMGRRFSPPAAATCRPCGKRSTRSSTTSSRAGRAGSASRSRPWRSSASCRPRCSTCRARGRTRSVSATCWPPSCSSRTPTRPSCCSRRYVTRLDVLNYISHGITKTPAGSGDPRPEEPAPAGQTGDGPAPARDPLAAFAVNLTERARQGRLDPLIGRRNELRRTLQILCPPAQEQPGLRRGRRRRQDRPRRGPGRPAAGGRRPRAPCRGRDLRPRHGRAARGHAVPGRLRGALQGGRRRPRRTPHAHSVHRRGACDGGGRRHHRGHDGPCDADQAPARGRGPQLIGSTTFDEFKQIERDRGLARRLQRVVLEEPSVDETVEILTGLRSRYEEHHRVTFTDRALQAAAKLARRHLRDSRLPDSAIDVLDEAGASFTVTGAAAPEATPSAGEAAPDRGPRHPRRPRPRRHPTQHPTQRGSRRPRRADTAAETPAPLPRVTAADIERVLARMARIPEKQATGSDKERLRTLDEALRRVVFGQDDAVAAVATAIKRARAGLGQPDSPCRMLPVHRPHRRRQDRACEAARHPPRERVPSL